MKKTVFDNLRRNTACTADYKKYSYKEFRLRIVFSFICILACLAVMVSSAYAFFCFRLTTDNFTISGAYFSVSIENTVNGTYVCPLAYGDRHVFEIKASGTATSGYCKIQIGENEYYTDRISQDAPLHVSVTAAENTVIYFVPQWGIISGSKCGDEILYSSTPHTLYVVEPTAALSDIAEYYGVAESDIMIYNNITELEIGSEIKIPNVPEGTAPYAVPFAIYTVHHGAILEDVAAYYGVSAENILLYNGITAIHEGLELRIPGVSPDYAPYSVPEEEQEKPEEHDQQEPDKTQKNENPTDDAPTDDVPTDDAPAEDTPTDDAPAEDAPAEDVPTDDAPAEDVPTDDAPTDDVPTDDAPAEDAPAEDAPAEDTPTDDAPAEDAPAEDVPTDDAPAEDTPTDDASTNFGESDNIMSECTENVDFTADMPAESNSDSEIFSQENALGDSPEEIMSDDEQTEEGA